MLDRNNIFNQSLPLCQKPLCSRKRPIRAILVNLEFWEGLAEVKDGSPDPDESSYLSSHILFYSVIVFLKEFPRIPATQEKFHPFSGGPFSFNMS